MKQGKVIILGMMGMILIALGLGVQLIQYHNEIDNLNKELNKANETIDQQATELIRYKEENDYLWSNYYMSVSDYEGEYQYYE